MKQKHIALFSLFFLFATSVQAGVNPAAVIAHQMCASLYACDTTLNFNACVNEALNSDQLLNQFGGPETDGQGIPFRRTKYAVRQGILQIDYQNVVGCLGELQNLACNSDHILYSWDATRPNDFSNLEQIVDGLAQCNAVFR